MPAVLCPPAPSAVASTLDAGTTLPNAAPTHADARAAVRAGQQATAVFRELLAQEPLAKLLPDLADLGGLGPDSYGRAVPHVLSSAARENVTEAPLTRLADAWERYQAALTLLDRYLLPQIERMADRFAGATSRSFYDDLVQEARTGTGEIIHRFDLAREDIKVATYGNWWANERMTKWLHNNARTVRTPVWFNKIEAKLQRAMAASEDPDRDHTLRALAKDAKLADEFLPAIGRRTTSMEAPLGPDGDAESFQATLADAHAPDPVATAEESERIARLAPRLERAWATLTSRERYVLTRYHCLQGDGPEPTYEEIGAELANVPNQPDKPANAVTAERVRQLRESALKKLQRGIWAPPEESVADNHPDGSTVTAIDWRKLLRSA